MPGISIFTASTPWLGWDELIPAIKAAGFDGVEVALKDRTWDPAKPADPWGNNAACLDWGAHLEEAQALRDLLDRHDLACNAIGSYVSIDDIDRIAQAVEVARILGCEFIRVRAPGYDPGIGYRRQLADTRACYRDLDQISAETGVDSLVEIHHRTISPSASAAMRILEGLDPTHVGVILDPGNTVDEGFEDIAFAIDQLGDFLRHIHLKDLERKPSDQGKPIGARWRGEACEPGSGALDWPAIIAALHEHGYDGWYAIENFHGRDRGPAAIADDAAWIKQLLGR